MLETADVKPLHSRPSKSSISKIH